MILVWKIDDLISLAENVLIYLHDIDLVFLRLKFSVQNFYRRQKNRKPLLGSIEWGCIQQQKIVLSMRQSVPVAKHKFIERFSFSSARTQANNFIPRIGKTMRNFSHGKENYFFVCVLIWDMTQASFWKGIFLSARFEWKRFTRIGFQTSRRHSDHIE